MISEFFSKEKLEVISFLKHVGFLARQLIFLSFLSFSFFPLFSSFLSYYHLFISSLFSLCFLFLSEKVMRARAHTTYLRLTTM